MTDVPPRSATPEPRQWWGVEHICDGELRKYPTLHWADEPEHGAGPRQAFECDACGQRYAFHEARSVPQSEREGLDVERLRDAMERAINNSDDAEAIAAEYNRRAALAFQPTEDR